MNSFSNFTDTLNELILIRDLSTKQMQNQLDYHKKLYTAGKTALIIPI